MCGHLRNRETIGATPGGFRYLRDTGSVHVHQRGAEGIQTPDLRCSE
jgi:hypothetical protein